MTHPNLAHFFLIHRTSIHFQRNGIQNIIVFNSDDKNYNWHINTLT